MERLTKFQTETIDHLIDKFIVKRRVVDLSANSNWSKGKVIKYEYTVQNTAFPASTAVQFDFFGSINERDEILRLNKKYDSSESVRKSTKAILEANNKETFAFALYCFIGDAVAGDMIFSDFCSEFGYDEDSQTAFNTYMECQKAFKKLKSIYDGDIYDLSNSLQEEFDL